MRQWRDKWHHGVVAILLSGLLVACGADPATSQGQAELFLDSYYVTIDLPTALQHTAGVAHDKVQQSIALTKGQEAAEASMRPHVRYELAEERPEGDATVHYVYNATVTADGDASQRKFMLTVRRGEDGWRVTNFQEFTPESPKPAS